MLRALHSACDSHKLAVRHKNWYTADWYAGQIKKYKVELDSLYAR